MARPKSLSRVRQERASCVAAPWVQVPLSIPPSGFDDLGGRDDFSTEMLEWRLGCAAVINYSGNLLEPPDQSSGKKQVHYHSKKSIREAQQDSSDSD